MASLTRTAYPRFSKRLSDAELAVRYGVSIDGRAFITPYGPIPSPRPDSPSRIRARQPAGARSASSGLWL